MINFGTNFSADFALVLGADERGRAAGVLALSKTYPLEESQYASAVATMVSWSDSKLIAIEALKALCVMRRVPSAIGLIARIWDRVDPLDVHWVASAFENSIRSLKDVDPGLLGSAIGLLCAPTAPRPDEETSSATLNHRRCRDAATRIVAHVGRVVGIDIPALTEPESIPGLELALVCNIVSKYLQAAGWTGVRGNAAGRGTR